MATATPTPGPANDLPPLLRPETLAPFLGITPAGVRAYIRHHGLPAAKVGRVWHIRRSAFIAWLERRERAQRTPTEPGDASARFLRALPPPRRRKAR